MSIFIFYFFECMSVQNYSFTKYFVRLNDSNITDKGCALLTAVLTSQSNVRELDLSNNNLQDSGVEILCVGVQKSPHGASLYAKINLREILEYYYLTNYTVLYCILCLHNVINCFSYQNKGN